MKKFARSFVLAALSAPLVLAHAAETPPGEVKTSFESPKNQVSESCSMPRALDLDATLASGVLSYLPFTKADEKVSKRSCAADFYDTRESTADVTATVICPKLGSTNPAVMLHDLPYPMTRREFIANECPKDHGRAGEMIAKFKQSVSCSNTSSILSYPRFGRMLRSEIEFPVVPYRSMDRREHLEFADHARQLALQVKGESDLITQTWNMIYSADKDPSHTKLRDLLYRDNDSIIFGGLVPDMKGDEIYWEANGKISKDVPRVKTFQQSAAYAAVTNPAPAAKLGANAEFTKETAQKLILLRDMGDLIILDSLLNQQDRFGNLHRRPHYVRMEADGSLNWVLGKKKKKETMTPEELAADTAHKFVPNEEQKAELTAQGFVQVDRMLLEDNDCGVAKDNSMAHENGGKGLVSKLAHLHPDTYLAIQNLQKLAKKGTLADYLKTEFVFRDTDVKSVQANLAYIADTLDTKCRGGKLFLDADIAQAFGKKAAVNSVAFCKANTAFPEKK